MEKPFIYDEHYLRKLTAKLIKSFFLFRPARLGPGQGLERAPMSDVSGAGSRRDAVHGRRERVLRRLGAPDVLLQPVRPHGHGEDRQVSFCCCFFRCENLLRAKFCDSILDTGQTSTYLTAQTDSRRYVPSAPRHCKDLRATSNLFSRII